MFIHFLVEDESGGKLIEHVMNKLTFEDSFIDMDYDIKSYKGIGKFQKGKNADLIKSQALLNELPKRIKAYHYYHLHNKENKAAVFIVVDNDRRDTNEFRNQLENTVKDNNITIDRVFCIAVEEIEAWLLGDYSALIKAYPGLENRIRQKITGYIQDEIWDEGTWEFLWDMLTPNNKRKDLSLINIGKLKSEWANNIGIHMDIHRNLSPSFNFFISEIEKRGRCGKTVKPL